MANVRVYVRRKIDGKRNYYSAPQVSSKTLHLAKESRSDTHNREASPSSATSGVLVRHFPFYRTHTYQACRRPGRGNWPPSMHMLRSTAKSVVPEYVVTAARGSMLEKRKGRPLGWSRPGKRSFFALT
jgi:hypothetical protein